MNKYYLIVLLIPLTIAGIILHEFTHVLFALAFGIRISKICLLNPNILTDSMAGYVEYSDNIPMHTLVISEIVAMLVFPIGLYMIFIILCLKRKGKRGK